MRYNNRGIKDRLSDVMPTDIVEAGFLFALLMGPFGPVLRYLGWLMALLGIVRRRSDWRRNFSTIPGWTKISFGLLLVWGGIITFYRSPDLHLFLKGWSVIFEFEFAVLLAFFVLRNPVSAKRCRSVVMILVILLGSSAVLGLFPDTRSLGIFSHFPTFYSTIAIPLAPVAIMPLLYEKRFSLSRFFDYLAFASLLLMSLIGLSSGAVLSIGGSLAVMVVVLRPGFRRSALLLLKVALVVVLVLGFSFVSGKEDVIFGKIRAEAMQLLAIDDSNKLTSGRSFIWKGAIHLFRENPLGIGWGFFESQFTENRNLEWFNYYEGPPSAPHNEFLSVLVEGGVVSLAAYLLFWAGCVMTVFRLVRNSGADRSKAAILAASLSGVFLFSLVGGIFDERQKLAIYFWTIFGAVLAAGYPDNPKRRENYRETGF